MKTRLKLIQYLGFVAVGVTSSIIGPLLPAIRSNLNINYTQAGMLLSGQFFGIMLTALVGGYVIGKSGNKSFLLAGSVLLFTGLAGSMIAQSYLLLYIANLITGIGFGIYEIGINALCADNSDANKGSDMSFLHFFYGAGAISGPILAAITVKYMNSWRLCFGFTAVFPLVVGAILLGSKASSLSISITKDTSDASAGSNPLTSRFAWIVGVATFFYVGIETSTGGWISEYWKALLPNSSFSAALVPSVFWISLTLGRLFAGKIADRIGLMKYLLAASSVTLLITAAWNMLPKNMILLVLVSLLGFALSGQFPSMMVVITSGFPGKTGMASAFMTVFAGVAGSVIPSVVGKAADMFGIQVLGLSILGFACFLVLFMLLVRKDFNNTNI